MLKQTTAKSLPNQDIDWAAIFKTNKIIAPNITYPKVFKSSPCAKPSSL